MQICGICGEPLGNNVTTDHVFPQAIYKWSEEDLSRQEYMRLKNRICGRANRIKAHGACNYAKQDELWDLEKLHVNRQKADQLVCLKEQIGEYIAEYSEKKREILIRQGQKCFWCQSLIEGSGIIRRIDPKEGRTRENACIVCADCNAARGDFLREDRD